jgi:two-component system sensor histidine kinase KdpD
MSSDTESFDHAHEEMQKRLFSAVAHDLKTPLACIIGSLDALTIMKDQLTSAQCDTLLYVAREHAQRLDELFNNMLDKVAPL